MSEPKFKAAIFDLDGTLLDTLADIADCMNTALSMHGYPAHDYARYKVMVGDGMDTLVRRALPEEHCNDANAAKCLGEMRTQYAQRWADKTTLYEGIPEMLDLLVRRGVKLAVLSNKPDDFTKVVVKKMLSRWNFDPALGARATVPKKPDPAGAIEIAEKLALKPAEFLYIGDTNTDMWTGKAAGMYTLGALWGFRTAEELQSSGARALIQHPGDILNFI
jgi:phosphoglycolate phosphatase